MYKRKQRGKDSSEVTVSPGKGDRGSESHLVGIGS